MKCYGYDRSEWEQAAEDDVTPKLREMREISLIASADQLRQIAQFILNSADTLEAQGNEFGHEHFRDFLDTWANDNLDIIICNQIQVS